jgi:hypothetical protein
VTSLKLYWTALFSSLFAACLWRNHRLYRQRSWFWKTGKAIFDAAIIGLLAAFCPPLLIAYCVLWITRWIPGNAVVKTTISVLAGLTFTLIGGFFLEALVLIGTFAIDILTGDVVRFWETTKE